jgi:hypothetical protein
VNTAIIRYKLKCDQSGLRGLPHEVVDQQEVERIVSVHQAQSHEQPQLPVKTVEIQELEGECVYACRMIKFEKKFTVLAPADMARLPHLINTNKNF